jgi:hypothetical protein
LTGISETEKIVEIKHVLEHLIQHKNVDSLRFKNGKFNETSSSKDIESFIRHLLFLYRTGRIQGLDFAPRRFLKAALLHYTLPREDGLRKSDDAASYGAWRKTLLTAVNRLESKTIKLLRGDVPREYFVWYWQGLKGIDLQSIIGNHKVASNPRANRRSGPTKYILIPPANLETATTYDNYLRDLLTRLHLKSETYDIVLLDCNSISEYRNKGIIDSITDIFGTGEPSGALIPQHFRVGATRNGSIDALPATRNFHLPAAHEAFFRHTPERSFENLRGIVRNFLGEGSMKGDADGLISDATNRQIYMHYWRLQHEGAQHRIAGSLDLSSDILVAKDSNAFSAVLSNNDSQKGRNDEHIKPILSPFTVASELGLPFIPMQLARGAHATYTFMAYTANGITNPVDPRQSFASTRPPPKQVMDEDDKGRMLYVYDQKVLQTRLFKVLNLIFNFVPDCALCLDHHFSALLRQSFSNHWFDPCLPIEAVGFQTEERGIDVLDEPARFGESKYLNCFGGFCFGVSSATSDPVDVAEVALRLAKLLSATPGTGAVRGLTTGVRKRLMSYDIALPLSDYDADFLKLPDEEKEEGAATTVPITTVTTATSKSSSDVLPTPKLGAVRPNFELWPQIEAEISDTFRLYIAALFIYRAIHMEVSALRHSTLHLFSKNILAGRATREKPSQDIDRYNNMLWLLGVIDAPHKTGERAALEALKPSDVRAYLKNLELLMRRLVAKSSSRVGAGYDLGAVIDNNIGPLMVDSDYVLGILRDCAERTERSDITQIKPDDLNDSDNAEIREERNDRRLAHFNSLRHTIVTGLSESLSETIIRKIQSNCNAHGWTVDFVGT